MLRRFALSQHDKESNLLKHVRWNFVGALRPTKLDKKLKRELKQAS